MNMNGNAKEVNLFNVVQFFRDNTFQYVKKHVPIEEAAETAKWLSTSVAARLGVTDKVMITDDEDNDCVFLWTGKSGIEFKKEEKREGKEVSHHGKETSK